MPSSTRCLFMIHSIVLVEKWFDYKTLAKAYKTVFTADVLETKIRKSWAWCSPDFSTRIEPTRIEAAKIRAQYKAKERSSSPEKKKWGDTSMPDAPLGMYFHRFMSRPNTRDCMRLKDGELILSTPVTTGRTTHQTIRGTFKIYSKNEITSWSLRSKTKIMSSGWIIGCLFLVLMVSNDSCNSKNCWRTKFGWNDYKYGGSHGCVNTPYSAVQFLYGWTRIGTTVHVD